MVHSSSLRHYIRFSNNRVTDRRTYGAAHIPTALQTHKHAQFHIITMQQFGLITGCWERPLFDSQRLCSFGYACVQIASAVIATNWILTDNQTEWIVSIHRGYCIRHKYTRLQMYKCGGHRVALGFSYRASFKYYDKGYQQMPLSFVIFPLHVLLTLRSLN